MDSNQTLALGLLTNKRSRHPKLDFRTNWCLCFLKYLPKITFDSMVFTLLNSYYTILSDIRLHFRAVLAHRVIHKVPTQTARERELSKILVMREIVAHGSKGRQTGVSFRGWIKEKTLTEWDIIFLSLICCRSMDLHAICSAAWTMQWVFQPWRAGKGRDEKQEGARWVHTWIIDSLW